MPTKRSLSQDERQTRREADREKAEAAVEAPKTSEGWKAWLRVWHHFREYSFNNQALIAAQCVNRPGFDGGLETRIMSWREGDSPVPWPVRRSTPMS